MRKNTYLLLTLFSLLALSSTATAQIVIDDFDSGNSIVQLTPGTVSQTTTSSDILGGQREDSITVPNGGAQGSLGFNVGNDSNLSVAQGGTDEIVVSLFYDQLAAFNLSAGGVLDAFELNFVSTDSPLPITNVLELSVTSGVDVASQTVEIPGSGSLNQPVLIEFSEFELIDFTAVDSVRLEFDFASAPGRDFGLGSFSAVAVSVPEPGSLALLSIASLVVLRRRRK